MKKYFLVFTLISAFWIISASAENVSWNGSYIYEADLGETAGGDFAVITYTLIIATNKCEMIVEGFQTSESIICKTKETNDKLDIYFQSYSDGSVKNKFGVGIYKAGGLLFQLNRTEDIKTIWGELLPDAKLEKTGRYFIKESKKYEGINNAKT